MDASRSTIRRASTARASLLPQLIRVEIASRRGPERLSAEDAGDMVAIWAGVVGPAVQRWRPGGGAGVPPAADPAEARIVDMFAEPAK